MKKLILVITLVLLLALSGCSTPREYRNHLNNLNSLEGYKMTMTLKDFSMLEVFVDNNSNVMYLGSSSLNNVNRVIELDGSKLYGYRHRDDVWSKYELTDINGSFNDESLIEEIVNYCDEWEVHGNFHKICDVYVVADKLGENMIDFLGKIYPDNPENYSVSIEVYYDTEHDRISKIDVSYKPMFVRYQTDHPSYQGEWGFIIEYDHMTDLDLQIPEDYEETDETMSLEDFL